MNSQTRYALVGGFVLILGALFIWGVLWISAGGPPQQFTLYTAYMTESVSGLNVDSALRYRGVDVGSVREISIDPKNPQRIRLLLQVRDGVPITEDTVAMLEYQGLTGIATVNLTGGDATSKPIAPTPGEDYPVIATRPSLFLRLDAGLFDLLESLTQTSASLNALLNDENRDRLSESFAHASTITANVAEQSGQIGRIVENLNATMTNLRVASDRFPELVEHFEQSAQAVTGAAERARQIGDSLGDSSADLTQFTATTLPDIAAIVAELRISAENLRRVTDSLANDPSVLIYGAAPPERGPGE